MVVNGIEEPRNEYERQIRNKMREVLNIIQLNTDTENDIMKEKNKKRKRKQ